MRTPLHFGGFEGRFSAVAAPLSVVVTAARLQAAGSLPGAFFGAAFALLNPPLAGDLLHAVPLLWITAAGERTKYVILEGETASLKGIYVINVNRLLAQTLGLHPCAHCPSVSTGTGKMKIT